MAARDQKRKRMLTRSIAVGGVHSHSCVVVSSIRVYGLSLLVDSMRILMYRRGVGTSALCDDLMMYK